MIIQLPTIERLDEIELERFQTQMDPNFQKWTKQLNVSRLHVYREGINKANQLMSGWDISKLFKDCSYF